MESLLLPPSSTKLLELNSMRSANKMSSVSQAQKDENPEDFLPLPLRNSLKKQAKTELLLKRRFQNIKNKKDKFHLNREKGSYMEPKVSDVHKSIFNQSKILSEYSESPKVNRLCNSPDKFLPENVYSNIGSNRYSSKNLRSTLDSPATNTFGKKTKSVVLINTSAPIMKNSGTRLTLGSITAKK